MRRNVESVEIESAAGRESFDNAIPLATLTMHWRCSSTPTSANATSSVRSRIKRTTQSHTDTTLLPRERKVWAVWNAHIPRESGEACNCQLP